MVNNVMETGNGYFLDLQYLLSNVAGGLLHKTAANEPISPWSAAVALLVFCAMLLALIKRKLRVCEVAG